MPERYLVIQSRTIISIQLSAPLALKQGPTCHVIFGSKMSTEFRKLSMILLYIKSHSFVINSYNKHQCIVNPGLKFKIPKLFLLVAE